MHQKLAMECKLMYLKEMYVELAMKEEGNMKNQQYQWSKEDETKTMFFSNQHQFGVLIFPFVN